MGNFSKTQERKEVREKTRRDKLAGYFFDLSKLIFAALVLGGITPVLAEASIAISWVTILLGV